MPNLGFMNTPEYQKLMLRVNRMRPEQMAVLNSLLVETDPAQADMKRQIMYGRLGEAKKGGEERLTLKTRDVREIMPLREKAFDVRTGLREAEQTQRLDLGLRGMESSYANQVARMESDEGLRRERLEREQSEILPAALISGANVLTSAGIGYANMKASERYESKMDEFLKNLNSIREG